MLAARAEEHEPDGRRVFRLLDGVGQAGDGRRNADAHRQTEHLGGGRLDAAQVRAAAGEHDLAQHLVARDALDDVRACARRKISSTRGTTIARSCDEVTSRVLRPSSVFTWNV